MGTSNSDPFSSASAVHSQVAAEHVIQISEAESASGWRLSRRTCAAGAEVECEPRWSGICGTLSSFLTIWSFRGNTERQRQAWRRHGRCGRNSIPPLSHNRKQFDRIPRGRSSAPRSIPVKWRAIARRIHDVSQGSDSGCREFGEIASAILVAVAVIAETRSIGGAR